MKKEPKTFDEYLGKLQENKNISETYGQVNGAYRKLKKDSYKKLVYDNVRNRLLNLTMNMYKWTCDDSINSRIIEEGFIFNGFVCGFECMLGKYVLPCNLSNMYNIYGEPSWVDVYGYNGWHIPVKIKYSYESPKPEGMSEFISGATGSDGIKGEGVYERDNDMGYKYIRYIEQYSYEIADKIVAFDIATQRLKSPFEYVVKEESLKDTIEKLVEKIENNDDLIIRLKGKAFDGKEISDIIQVIPNNMKSDVTRAIKEAIVFDIDSFLEIIGVNTNPSPDKAQVVLTDELNSNNDLIEIESDVRYKHRKEFCKKCKSIGINIEVEKVQDEIIKRQAEQMKNSLIGGDENGKFRADGSNERQPSQNNDRQ